MMTPSIDLDAELDRLQLAAAAASSNLVDLERDPTRVLLEQATLSGDTEARWQSAHDALADLWRWLSLLDSTLERATEYRAKRRAASNGATQVADLLHGRSIEVATTDVGLVDRGLFEASSMVIRCTPDELLARMDGAFDTVKAVIGEAGFAWDTLVPRLGGARDALTELTIANRDLGLDPSAELEHRHAELAERILTDPLSVSETDVDALETDLTSRRAELDAARDMRDNLDARLVDARSTLDLIEGLSSDSERLRDEVVAKILCAVPARSVTDADLSTDLDGVVALTSAGEWQRAATALTAWNQRAELARQESDRIDAEHRALLDRRAELRGLLDAYQAKTAKWRLLEDAPLSDAYSHAQTLLYTAPTDLERADQYVREYQRQLRAAIDSSDGDT